MENLFEHDTETPILSLVLTHPELIDTFESTVKDFMFSSTPNQVVWRAIKSVKDKGLVPDRDMVLTELKLSNLLVSAGADSYVNYLATQSYSSENAEEYLRQLTNTYKGRMLIAITSGLADKVVTGKDVDIQIDDIRGKLDQLQDNSAIGSSNAIGEVTDEIYGNIYNKTKNPGKVGIPFGLGDLDLFTGGIEPGELWFLAGRPGMFKTGTMLVSAVETAKMGNSCAIFSLEMSKQKLVERMLSKETEIPQQDIHLGILNDKQLKQIREKLEDFKKLPMVIDTNFLPSIEYITATARKLKKQRDLKILYVDYIQLLSGRDDDDTKELGRLSRAFKLLAERLEIGVVLLSQLNRKVEERPDKRPMMSDLRQSGNLEEDADLIGMLYRDEYYNKDSTAKGILEFIIRKYRNGSSGTLFFNVDLTTQRILPK